MTFVTRMADVRDIAALRAAFNDGVAELRRIDIVLANAGIMPFGDTDYEQDDEFDNLVWDVATRVMLDGGAVQLCSIR
jgi:NADP-dependent 3-hydroxy acid dehydrogenase YdfG